MKLTMEPFCEENLPEITRIWNSVVEQGDSFPGDQILSLEEAREMFAAQTETVCVRLDGEVVGVYILHPNHIGRCSHVANASYGVKPGCRGAGIGRRWCSIPSTAPGSMDFAGCSLTRWYAQTPPPSIFMSSWALPEWASSPADTASKTALMRIS